MIEHVENIHCGICGLNNDTKFTIQCEECKMWIHYNCTALPLYQLLCLARTNRKFSCEKCCFDKYADPEWSSKASEAMERQKIIASTQVALSQVTTASVTTDTQIHPSDEAITPYQHQLTADDAQREGLGNSPEDINLDLLSPSPATSGNSAHSQQASTQADQNTEAATSDKRERAVCRYYRKGNCKHGIVGRECKFSHPKPCRRFMEHGNKNRRGCKLGNKCRWFHPTLCKNSLTNHECFVDSCKQLHVKGTRRQRTLGTQETTTPTPSGTLNAVHGGRTAVTVPQSRSPTIVAGSEVSQEANFLDLMKGMKSAIDVMAKAVASQEIMLANIMKGNRPNWVNIPQPQTGPNNQQVPWLTALTSL